MSPKCGTTTIANFLGVCQHHKYNEEEINNLNNPEYKKIIIIRQNICDRFLSGFYEDLFNNTCYDNMNITFDNYLNFLYYCFKNKIPNVNNTKVYNDLDIPIWFGNCSNYSLNITDDNGNYCSHIMSQKYAISHIINQIYCKNVFLIDINNLSSILQYSTIRCNVKKKTYYNISEIPLSQIKFNKIIISEISLNEIQKKKILEIFDEDIIFINELKNKYDFI